MASVELTKDNALTCLCSKCPVQAESACVAEKTTSLMVAMEGEMEDMPSPADVPRVYCSTGVATCDDLDLSQICICGECPVFEENGLGQWKYCQRGSAASIG